MNLSADLREFIELLNSRGVDRFSISRLRSPVSTKPVFGPGIGGVAVAAHFPEAGFVFGDEFD